MNPQLPVSVSARGIWVLGAMLLIGGGGLAAARPVDPTPTEPPVLTSDGQVARRIAVATPIESYATPYAGVSHTIYLERCRGGCAVHGGNNDAHSNMSSIPMKAESTITEFANTAGLIGDAATSEWNQVVQCMKEVYSPFDVVVTDVRPTSGLSFHMAIIAGKPRDIGFTTDDILGVAPLANDCRAIDNVISFTFANQHLKNAQDITANIQNICWTAAQESAHAFGLDHEYSFTTANAANNHSACNDPMTYRNDCGGQKFFRNEDARCGEVSSRACKCGMTQNSHLKMLTVFGMGTPTTGSPTAALTSPLADTMIAANQVITLQAGGRRGVSRVALYLNGYKWTDQQGARYDAHGQPNPSSYALRVPADLPDSIVDVKAVAYDDIGTSTDSAVVTVTKGAPCTSATTCATGQKCEAGKCFWDPPPGEIGAICSYKQFCKSDLCTGTKEQQICTQDCIPGVADGCPDGLECVMSSPTTGVCFFSSSAGCCSVDGSRTTWWVHIGLAAAVLGFATRRRRR